MRVRGAKNIVFAAVLTAFTLTLSGAMSAHASSPGASWDIQKVFGKPQYRSAVWGLRVLDGKKVIVDINPSRQFYIGSVRKVFSVGQLLNTIGPQHRYNTPVYRTGAIRDGVLRGNLILVASGDLTMGGRTNPDGTIAVSNWDHNEADSLGNAILTAPNPLAGYARLARAVKAAGINRVSGNVIIDDRLFQPFYFRNQFYVRPIFVNDDVVDVSVTPGGAVGARAKVTTRPISAALRVDNGLRVGPAGSKNSMKIAPELPTCIGTPGCMATISGSLPADFKPPLTGRSQLVQTIRITQPSNYARTVFIEQLRAAGVAVTAPPVQRNPAALLPSAATYRAQNKVAELTGLPYGEDAKFILKISYNIGADTSLVLLGVRNNAPSMPAALGFERKNLQARWGIPSSQYHFVDGSGGEETTATNSAVTKMLDELRASPASQAFITSLPILGVDGSLAFVKNFESDRSLAGAAGNVRAKTGTYVGASKTGVVELKAQAIGGYITTKRGHRLTFQLVVNHVPINGIADLIKVFQDEGTVAAMLWRDY
ncbi:MAG TPA: D-alanyl-D-alanine carboxypeptidase [Candidatus Baltobacteraceae bacterium]|jgi:PBP4 family serine-type D-alanyl-D-alanine carboxypeptidase|nr:D-alanyl-D-alanine carboxypeptidase [Candidatus Baltobacteraceae bacterium]